MTKNVIFVFLNELSDRTLSKCLTPKM